MKEKIDLTIVVRFRMKAVQEKELRKKWKRI